MRVDQHFGAERAAAILALVAIGTRVAADGTGTHDISVGEKGLCFFVIVLLAVLYFQFAAVIQKSKELLRSLMVKRFAGTVINIERDTQIGEVLFDQLVVFVDN